MLTGTIVLLLYLVYPSICSSVLSLWRCQEVKGVGLIFMVDPETLCDDSTHQAWVWGVGVPSVLGYVIGLPLASVALLYKFRKKLNEPRTRIRLGLLYDGFKRENYMHEVWVVVRKVSVIVIGIFVGKLQVLLSIGVVGMLLVHTVLAQPFQTTMLSRLEILLLTCCFLTLWIGGIFVVYPQCRSEESSAHYICLVGEAVVLAMNIVCSFVGLGTYIWLAWMEQRDQITGRGKKVCGKCFSPVARKGLANGYVRARWSG